MYASGPRVYVVRLAIETLEGRGEETAEFVDQANGHSTG